MRPPFFGGRTLHLHRKRRERFNASFSNAKHEVLRPLRGIFEKWGRKQKVTKQIAFYG
jgi:hypothetical protein